MFECINIITSKLENIKFSLEKSNYHNANYNHIQVPCSQNNSHWVLIALTPRKKNTIHDWDSFAHCVNSEILNSSKLLMHAITKKQTQQ